MAFCTVGDFPGDAQGVEARRSGCHELLQQMFPHKRYTKVTLHAFAFNECHACRQCIVHQTPFRQACKQWLPAQLIPVSVQFCFVFHMQCSLRYICVIQTTIKKYIMLCTVYHCHRKHQGSPALASQLHRLTHEGSVARSSCSSWQERDFQF